jgi:hypothetical protein
MKSNVEKETKGALDGDGDENKKRNFAGICEKHSGHSPGRTGHIFLYRMAIADRAAAFPTYGSHAENGQRGGADIALGIQERAHAQEHHAMAAFIR